MFPHNREVPEDLLQELSGILLHAGIGTSGPRLGCRVTYEWPRLYDFSKLYRGLFGTGASQAPQLREGHKKRWRKLWVLRLRSW
jgi:hypothetical protein